MFTQILAYTLPSLVVAFCVWLILHTEHKNEDEKRQWELKKASQKEISPLRLRAYERLTLLLERTTPEHLLMNMDFTQMSITDLQRYLLRQIRAEYDHNMSQQIYVSDEVWDKIIMSRNEIAAFIATMALQLPKEATTMDYAQTLMTAYNTNGETPHQIALQALKDEAKTLL